MGSGRWCCASPSGRSPGCCWAYAKVAHEERWLHAGAHCGLGAAVQYSGGRARLGGVWWRRLDLH
eukprot:10177950-Alexandrium_andersonii.AAC.1